MPREPKPTGDPYAILGLEPGATVAEARIAYYRRARLLHPDHHPDATDDERARLQQAMTALNLAWDAIEQADAVAPPPRTWSILDMDAVEVVDVPGFVGGNRWDVGLRLMGEPEAIAGLREVAADVTTLNFHDRPVEDHHLALAGNLPGLHRLVLADTRVTDVGLGIIAERFPAIRDLDLSATAVTDAGLPRLAALPSLHRLTMVDTAITDAGLEVLATMASLEMLNLRGAPVRGEGLHHLVRLPRLRLLAVSRVERADRRAFAAARPDVEVV